MTRSLSIVLALMLAPLPVAATTTATYTTAGERTKGAPAKTVTMADGLKYVDVKVGKGAIPKAGQTAVVHYTGTFLDGKQFDSSRGRAPFEFVLGQHGVIACWDRAVATMHVGGRRKLICPPAVAYGAKGYPGAIPPNTTLLFDVELLAIK